MNKSHFDAHTPDANERIRAAFIELLFEKPYKKITLQEIADACQISRQNLYYYYRTKESILEEIIEEFFDRIYESMMDFSFKNLSSDDKDELGKQLMRAIVLELKANQDLARRLFSEDISRVYYERQTAFLKRMLGSLIRARNIQVNDPKYIHYLALQLSGASFSIIQEWLVVDNKFPVERIVELGHPMLEQIIKSMEKN